MLKKLVNLLKYDNSRRLFRYHTLGCKYIGIDTNEEAIRITKERLKNESRNKNR